MNKHSLFFSPTDQFEILKTINNLRNKAGGEDGISGKALKILAPYISYPLANIFNMVMEKGIFPTHFKKADIIPIYKSGDKKLMNNYRPIALISNLAKVLEKLIHCRLLNFLNKNKILSNFQYGFRTNMGAKDALAYISDLLFNKLDKSSPTIGVFLDLAKAFDVVDFKILIKKLYIYGVRGVAFKLFENYLSNRTQTVKLNNYKSEVKNPSTGVPQGTVLGPLLFLIYMNDIFDVLPHNNLFAYADDTFVLCSEPTWNLTISKTNEVLNKIYFWLYKNKLTLNLKKTVYITFGNYYDSVPETTSIKINDITIDRVSDSKYLGVILDQRMKWKEHI